MREWLPWLAGVAVANGLLLAALFATRKTWLHSQTPQAPEIGARPPLHVAPVLAIAAAAVCCAALGFARLDQSFWDDEASAMKRGIHGLYVEREAGWVFKERGWSDALWSYKIPNNHVPFTLLARVSLGVWRTATDAPRRMFDEAAVRVPVWLLGFVSVASLAAFLYRLGHPSAAVLAAWLLALHPWHLRYTTEARGYILVIALVPALLTFLLAALEHGTWRRWGLFGAAQMLMLWVFPGALWAVVFTNASALLAIAGVYGAGPAGRVQGTRWLVVGIVAAMAWVQIFVPNLVQLVTYMGDPHVQAGNTGLRWLQDEFAYLATGMPWDQPRKLGPGYLELVRLAAANPALASGLATAMIVGLVAGITELWRAGGARRALLPALLLPGPITWLQSRIGGQYLFEWYLIFVLPAWIALLALGLDALRRAARGRTQWAVAAAIVAYVFGFAALTEPARDRLREASLQPHRESVLATRPTLDPLDPENERIVTATFTAGSPFYDPRTIDFETREELLALMAHADQTGDPLYVNHGWHIVKKRRKPFEDLLLDPQTFEEVAMIPGFKPRLTRFVYRYRGRR